MPLRVGLSRGSQRADFGSPRSLAICTWERQTLVWHVFYVFIFFPVLCAFCANLVICFLIQAFFLCVLSVPSVFSVRTLF
jgi:hypothetical protein